MNAGVTINAGSVVVSSSTLVLNGGVLGGPGSYGDVTVASSGAIQCNAPTIVQDLRVSQASTVSVNAELSVHGELWVDTGSVVQKK